MPVSTACETPGLFYSSQSSISSSDYFSAQKAPGPMPQPLTPQAWLQPREGETDISSDAHHQRAPFQPVTSSLKRPVPLGPIPGLRASSVRRLLFIVDRARPKLAIIRSSQAHRRPRTRSVTRSPPSTQVPGRVMGHARLTQEAAGKKKSLKAPTCTSLAVHVLCALCCTNDIRNVPPSRPSLLRRSAHTLAPGTVA